MTRAQLLAIGLGPAAIKYRLHHGRLYRVHRGVYAVGRPAVTPLERVAAAVLACGPEAALSHASALTLWGFWRRWDQPFEVTVTGDRRPPGIRVHRASRLARRDLSRQLGIRVTTPARTVLDIATRLSERQLRRAVNDGLNARTLHQAALDDVVQRNPGHRGAHRLRPFASTDEQLTLSTLEDDFLTFCQAYGLPRPEVNVFVGRYMVDALFGAERVIVELDGWGFHGSRVSFESDRERDAHTLEAGHATYRLTQRRLRGDPDREARRLHRILAERRYYTAAP